MCLGKSNLVGRYANSVCMANFKLPHSKATVCGNQNVGDAESCSAFNSSGSPVGMMLFQSPFKLLPKS